MNLTQKMKSIFRKPEGARSSEADRIMSNVVKKNEQMVKKIEKVNRKIEKTQTYFILKAMGVIHGRY